MDNIAEQFLHAAVIACEIACAAVLFVVIGAFLHFLLTHLALYIGTGLLVSAAVALGWLGVTAWTKRSTPQAESEYEDGAP